MPYTINGSTQRRQLAPPSLPRWPDHRKSFSINKVLQFRRELQRFMEKTTYPVFLLLSIRMDLKNAALATTATVRPLGGVAGGDIPASQPLNRPRRPCRLTRRSPNEEQRQNTEVKAGYTLTHPSAVDRCFLRARYALNALERHKYPGAGTAGFPGHPTECGRSIQRYRHRQRNSPGAGPSVHADARHRGGGSAGK